MNDLGIFVYGVLVSLLFLAGIIFTVLEFRRMGNR